MSRWSNPSSGLTQDRFKVWSVGDDLYSRAELEENWDTLDAIIGRPVDGVTVWPPLAERGNGKGMWLYFQQLFAERPKLGDVKWLWAPTQSALTAIITQQQSAGFEVANGQGIDASDHDFGDIDPSLSGDTVYLPDLVGHFAIGVAHDSTVGESGGVTTNDGANNVGTQGSNTDSIDVDVASHTHSVPSHSHSTPDHRHGMQHRHYMYHDDILPGGAEDPAQGLQQTGQSRFGIVYRLRASAIADSGVYPAAEDDEYTQGDPGWEYAVPGANHRHHMFATVSGLPVRGPTGDVKLVMQTDTGGSGSTGTWSGTTGSGGAISESYTIDTKPLSVGLVPFIKVRNATGI